MLLSAHEVEEWISGLAVHLRCLTQVLDACGKRCPKTDHFDRQLQLSDRCFWWNSAKTQHHSNVIFGLQLLRGWGYILAQDRRSQLFPFSRYWCQNIDVSDSWSLILIYPIIEFRKVVVAILLLLWHLNDVSLWLAIGSMHKHKNSIREQSISQTMSFMSPKLITPVHRNVYVGGMYSQFW